MNRREAEELLPWFVAGTLEEEEARAVQAFIDTGEISSNDLEELALFSETVAERQSSEPEFNPAILEKAMSQLDGITQEAPEVPVVVGEVGRDAGAGGRARDAEDTPGLLQRILNALQWSLTPPMARVALVGQFALLFGLAIMVATNTDTPKELPGEQSFETVSGTPTMAAMTPDFSISVAPGVSEANFRALLVEHRVSIVAGPSAFGLYQVAVPDGADIEAIAEQLTASPLIVFLQPVAQP